MEPTNEPNPSPETQQPNEVSSDFVMPGGATPINSPSTPAGPTVSTMAAVPEPTQVPTPSLNQPVVGHISSDGNSSPKNFNSFKTPKFKLPKGKALIISIVVALVVLGGAGYAYVGLYLPNQPSHIWSTAMSRTGKGYDKLASYVRTQSNTSYKGYTLQGSLGFKTTGSSNFSGSLDSSSDGTNSSTKLSANVAVTTVSIALLTHKVSGSQEPDIYLQLSGLKPISSYLGAYSQQLAALDGKWILADHNYLNQLAKQIKQNLPAQTKSSTTLTSKDVLNSVLALTDVSKQYALTTDGSKAITYVKQDVGKEKMDGRNVYHFKIGYNKTNLKAYVKALSDAFASTQLAKWLSSETGTPPSQFIDTASLDKSIDNLSNSRTDDVFVDLGTGLVKTVRFSDQSDPTNKYVDFGLNYVSGSQYPFAITFHDKSSGKDVTGTLSLTIDSAKNSATIGFNYGDSNYSFTSSVNYQPSNNPVSISLPTSTIPISQVLSSLGLQDYINSLTQIPSFLGNSALQPTSLILKGPAAKL